MSFMERWYNTFVTLFDWIVRHLVFLPSERAYANKYFAHLGPLPHLNDIIHNVSVVLVNSHRSISPPRPSMPSIYSLQSQKIQRNSVQYFRFYFVLYQMLFRLEERI